MMPWPKLMMTPVTSSQPPHRTVAARNRSVRPARSDSHSKATIRIRAVGSSHDTWPPKSESKSRLHPVAPHLLVPPAAPAPPVTLPVSFPVIRPSPL